MHGVSAEQIEQAKRWDLLSYLQAYEPQELQRSGPREYRTVTHDSLAISTAKLTERTLRTAIQRFLAAVKKSRDSPKIHRGKQSQAACGTERRGFQH